MRLPTRRDCPKCNPDRTQRESQSNRQSVHDRLGPRIMDRRVNNLEVAHHESHSEEEYVWQEGQWCPSGLSRSQKRRVQRLRNTEIKQDKVIRAKRAQVWKAKQTVNSAKSANIGMQCVLLMEFKASEDLEVYSDFDESEYEELVAKLAHPSSRYHCGCVQ